MYIMAELLPCPFCGGKPTTSRGVVEADEKFVFVSCEKCQSKTRRFYEWNSEDEQDAINAWNTRTPKERGGEK